MAPKTILGSESLGKKIRSRRNELGLTLEEAASRAGVGTKTWFRYEAGGSVRRDKCAGICRALNWRSFPPDTDAGERKSMTEEYKNSETWSRFLEKNYGTGAAFSFAAGSQILLNHIAEDMGGLASMPPGSHIGQLDISFIMDDLPEQFLMRYTYDFLFQMKCALIRLQGRAAAGAALTAHTVLEELLIYLCSQEAAALMELCDENLISYGKAFDDWVFDLFGDTDLITCLYSDCCLDEDHIYHFIHWNDQQFYTDL